MDLEAGELVIVEGDGDGMDEEKKGEAGLLPAIVQIWSLVKWVIFLWPAFDVIFLLFHCAIRSTCPALLPYIGEKPPRLSTTSQVMLVYFVLLHLLLWWESSSSCNATNPVPIQRIAASDRPLPGGTI